jgi:hypothetical protein
MKRITLLLALAFALIPLAAAADVAYNGPVDPSDDTYYGADETGSYDGTQRVSNADDFTAVSIPLSNPNPAPANVGTTPGSPVGNTFSVDSAPVVDVPNMMYYSNTDSNTPVRIAVSAPTGWSAQVCQDAGGGEGGEGGDGGGGITTTPTSANCTPVDNENCSYPGWKTVGGTATATFCAQGRAAVNTVYWVRYTGPTTLVAFHRYDAVITVSGRVSNATHNELYAGIVALTKSYAVASSNCPAGVQPTYPLLGVCPGGVVRFTTDYRNIVAGGGMGTEGADARAFPVTAPGSFVLTDDGTISIASQTNAANWGTFGAGLYAQLQPGLGTSGNANCGDAGGACGDSTAGTTFVYAAGVPHGTYAASYAAGVTAFQATIGGASGQLYPAGLARTWQGTITCAVIVR